MPWVRIDDHFNEHPKHARVGPLAWGVWLAGLAYCNRNLTDGFIPRSVAMTLACFEVVDAEGRVWKLARTSGMVGEDVDMGWVIQLLVDAGLWEEVPGGYRVHDYHDYQPSREEVEAERAIARRRAALNNNPKLAKAIKERDGNRCRYCGREVNWRDRKSEAGATYDHVIPISKGGTDDVDNIVVCCRACNMRKGGRTPEEAGMTLLPPPIKPGSSGNLASIYQESSRNLAGNQQESSQDQAENKPESRQPVPVPDPGNTPQETCVNKASSSLRSNTAGTGADDADQRMDGQADGGAAPAAETGGRGDADSPSLPAGSAVALEGAGAVRDADPDLRPVHDAYFEVTGRALMPGRDIETLRELLQIASPEQIAAAIREVGARAREAGTRPRSLRYFADAVREAVAAKKPAKKLDYDLPDPDSEMERRRAERAKWWREQMAAKAQGRAPA